MGYTKYNYQVVKLDKRAYWPRADDPMKMVRAEWDKAMLVSRMWYKESMRKAYFSDESVGSRVRPTVVMDARIKGATFTTPEQCEGVPYGDNESDMKALEMEHERRYKAATLENTSNRVKMMLGMLGDVQVIDKSEMDYGQQARLRYRDDKFKVFKVKDCTLILFEPEGVA